MKISNILNYCVICMIVMAFQFQSIGAQALGYSNHRIACSADGNNQPDNDPYPTYPRADPDDWGGTPAALAMIAKLGLQDKLVHFSYNNFIGAPPHTTETNHMKIGADGAIQRWGFSGSRFYDVSANNAVAITHLADELKKSSASDPLYFIHMGPSEFFYQAVKEVVDAGKASVLDNVQVISHSGYNDTHLRRATHHTMDEAIALSGDRIQYKKIKDQNACTDHSSLWCSETDYSPWHWMRDHPQEDLQWIYTRMEAAGKADISDAGMVWYLLENDENGSPSKLEDFIGDCIVCEDVQFFIINRATGKKIRHKDSVDGDALQLVPASWTGSLTKWTKVDTDNEYFYLKNVSTGMYFRPTDDTDGSVLIQRPTSYDGSYTQWKQVDSSEDYFYLENRATGMYFRPDTDADYSPIIQRPTSYSGSWTQWMFVDVDSGEALKSAVLNEIVSQDNTFEVSIYPNPIRSGELNILVNGEVKNHRLEILDLSGKQIYSIQLLDTSSVSIGIDELNLRKGLYIIKVSNTSGSTVQKLIVE